MKEFIYRWTESGNGPFEVKGSALSIYRAGIMISHSTGMFERPQVRGQILNLDGTEINEDEFFTESMKNVQAL